MVWDEIKERTDSCSVDRGEDELGLRVRLPPGMRSKEIPANWRAVGKSGGEDQDWKEGRRRL